MIDLNEVGGRIQDAYASSAGEGQAMWMSYAGGGVRVFHVPALPTDGALISAEDMKRAGGAELQVLDRVGVRITVDNFRVSGDDMLIMEATFAGKIPDGATFSFPLTLVFSFRDGAIDRLIQVGSAEMMATMRRAFERFGSDQAGATVS